MGILTSQQTSAPTCTTFYTFDIQIFKTASELLRFFMFLDAEFDSSGAVLAYNNNKGKKCLLVQ